jgi:hypothetical protein
MALAANCRVADSMKSAAFAWQQADRNHHLIP